MKSITVHEPFITGDEDRDIDESDSEDCDMRDTTVTTGG